MSLSDEDLLRIREQEEYRLAIRKELQANQPVSTKDQVWKFMNSAFGLFLMSSILVGGFSWGYGLFEKSQKITSEQSELLKKSDLEISYRISPIFSLYDSNGKIDNLILSDLKHIFGSEPPENHNFMVSEARALFPDLKSRNLAGLFYAVIINAEKDKSAKAKETVEYLVKFERVMKSAPKQEINLSDHVIDEVPIFNSEQNKFIQNTLIPSLEQWK